MLTNDEQRVLQAYTTRLCVTVSWSSRSCECGHMSLPRRLLVVVSCDRRSETILMPGSG